MKNIFVLAAFAVMVIIISSALFTSGEVQTSPIKEKKNFSKTPTYIIIAWNDLGMHCSNKYFNKFAVLPPYNNQKAQVIKVGNSTTLPVIDTTGFSVTYEIPGNTYSVGKTDFWSYANALFGVTLANNIGLTGVGLSGNMTYSGNTFHVEGIPVTPYPDNDLVNEHPYQLTLIKVYDASSNLLASTQSVIPVSNELNCVSSGCHSSEQDILNKHESVAGFDPNVTPILCADCHKDNALNMPGISAAPSFSQAIHGAHGSRTNDCYKCHPGPNTQCLRDTMHSRGMICQDCHGSVSNVALTIENGREAWLQEPDCGTNYCHGSNHASEPGKLYRNSKGHSSLYCSACHNSPHAIMPTSQPNDNVQNINLQGHKGTLSKCSVCHGYTPSGAGPHGIFASDIDYDNANQTENNLLDIFPNPVSASGTIPFLLANKSKVKLVLYNTNGEQVRLFLDQHLVSGSYNITFSAENLKSGVYYCVLKIGDVVFTKKIAVLK